MICNHQVLVRFQYGGAPNKARYILVAFLVQNPSSNWSVSYFAWVVKSVDTRDLKSLDESYMCSSLNVAKILYRRYGGFTICLGQIDVQF